MENKKKTLVIGASPKPERYSNKAVRMLREYNHEVLALGKRQGMAGDTVIRTEFPENEDIHTVTMYLGKERQAEYYEALEELRPRRVIFNPGTENRELSGRLNSAGIETEEACTLLLLRTGQY